MSIRQITKKRYNNFAFNTNLTVPLMAYSKIRQMAVIYMGYKRKVTQVVTQMEKAVTYNVSVALTADGLCSQIRRSS